MTASPNLNTSSTRKRQRPARLMVTLLGLLAATAATPALAAGPGGVSAGLTQWYDASFGVSNPGTTSITWARKSDSTGPVTAPLTYRLDGTSTSPDSINLTPGAFNFNPALTYSGKAYLGSPANLTNTDVTPADRGSSFGVGFGGDQITFLGDGLSGADPCGTNRCNVGLRFNRSNFGSTGTSGTSTFEGLSSYNGADGPTANIYGLSAQTGVSHTSIRNGWTNPVGTSIDRALQLPNLNKNFYQLRLGSFPGFAYGGGTSGGGGPTSGQMAEGMYFNRQLSATEMQQVSSYLGIKYGITQDSDGTRNNTTSFDYLSSSGGQVWSGSNATYSPYHNNVFGLAYDSNGNLDQRIATSINNSGPLTNPIYALDILTAATGTLSAPSAFVYTLQTNAAGTAPGNGTQLSNGQYLMMGNNAQSTAAGTNITVTGNTTDSTLDGAWTRLDRQWRAQNTNGVGEVSLKFDVPLGGVKALGDLNKVVLLVDNDGDYTKGGPRFVTAGRSVSGNQISFNVTLASGEIFTLASPPNLDLSLTKSDGLDSFAPGQVTNYTVVVTNAGPRNATNAIFTDPAVANLTVTNVTCGSVTGSGVVGNLLGNGECPTVANTTVTNMQSPGGILIPYLPFKSSVTFTVTATVGAGATGTIANTATITAPTGLVDTQNNTATGVNNSDKDTNTVTLPPPDTCPVDSPVNLLAPTAQKYLNNNISGGVKPTGASAFAFGTGDTDNQTYIQPIPLIGTASSYSKGTEATNGRFIVDMRWAWSSGNPPETSKPMTFTLRVNNIDYAVMTTSDGAGTVASIVGLSGASVSQAGVSASPIGFGGNPTTPSYVTLPSSVTSISSASMVYNNSTAGGMSGDDGLYNIYSILACPVVQPNITLDKYVRNVTTGTSFSYTSVPAKPKDIIEYCIAYINNGGNAANFVLTDNVPAGMFVLAAATPDLSNAYGAGSSISWSNTSNTVSGNTTPTGSNLTNAKGSPTDDDQGILTGAGTGTHTAGLLTLTLGGTGLPYLGKGTVCFQTQVP